MSQPKCNISQGKTRHAKR